jgi:predicted phosphodiesterase
MLRLHVLSDLHVDIEKNGWTPPADIRCDAVACAGDVMAPGSHGMRWLRDNFPHQRILFVPGNHCFYSEGAPKKVEQDPSIKTTWPDEMAKMEELAHEMDIDLLQNRTITIAGVDIHGCTLWTDFRVNEAQFGRTWGPHDNLREAAGRHGMRDYRTIKMPPGRSKDMLRPSDTIAAHKESRAWLETALLTSMVEGRESVVMTHHAPSALSLRGEGRQFFDLDYCYASNLDALCEGNAAPSTWIHGHVHHNRDYQIGNTRVVCNPRGYPYSHAYHSGSDWQRTRENEHFNPEMVIEVGMVPTPKMGM